MKRLSENAERPLPFSILYITDEFYLADLVIIGDVRLQKFSN